MGANASLAPSSLAQQPADEGLKRVRHGMMQQLPLPTHTGILSTQVRMQVREALLSLRLRRDLLIFLLTFCTPADVGHLGGADRSIYECCEEDAVWDMMLLADFWMAPAPQVPRPLRATRPVFDGIISRHISRLNSEILGKVCPTSSISSKRLLIHRWQGEVDLRKKQVLRERIQQLQTERDLRLAECRQRWSCVIRRRRAIALALWMLVLLCCLRWSSKFWPVLAVKCVARHSYNLFYNLSWLVFQFAPAAMFEGLCMLVLLRSRKRGRRPGHGLGCAAMQYARRSCLVCLSWYASVHRHEWPCFKRCQDIASVVCMLVAGWGAFAAAFVSTVMLLGVSALVAYCTSWRARCWTREFMAVAQRDQQERIITEDYQGKIRKCRVALGLPPEDRKPNCNCRVL